MVEILDLHCFLTNLFLQVFIGSSQLLYFYCVCS